MSGASKKLMQAAGAGAGVEPDEFFNQTTLLLHGDGTNGAQNNTFLDSSTNNFTITRNGNTTQGSFSPFGDRWSNYFDGSGDALIVPSSTAFDFGSGELTVEAFVYFNQVDTRQQIVLVNGNAANAGYGAVRIETNLGKYRLLISNESADNWVIVSSSTLDVIPNQWHHVAVTRSGTIFRVFVNGSLAIEQDPGSLTLPSGNPSYVGAGVDVGDVIINSVDGYIADARIIKGTAIYTTAFTPPTAPLTAISGTSLLTCQSNGFKDNSANNFAITRNGDVKVTTFSPYAPSAAYNPAVNGGSGYFDGATDWLNAPYTVLASEWTIELWAYANTLGGSRGLFGMSKIEPDSNIVLRADNNNLQFWVAGYGAIVTSSSAISVGAWNHIALVRSGSTNTLYLNGANVGSNTITPVQANTPQISIGRTYDATADEYWNGYIADVRFVNGTAVYTTSFTPPTAPLTAVTNTSLLCNFTNAAIFDSTAKNVLETVGNAQIDTAVVKYGTGSMEFDGTGDYLVMPVSENLQFGSGNFTIEGWVNVPSVDATFLCILSIGPPVQVYARSGTIEVYFNDSDDTGTYIVNGTTGPASSISTNTWAHFAVVRNGTTFTVYVDGVGGVAATGVSASVAASATAPAVGISLSTMSLPYTGYIDDLRITKGVARYTANFTPPTRAFPEQ